MSTIKATITFILSLLIPFMIIIGSVTLLSQVSFFYAYEFEKLSVFDEIGLETSPKQVANTIANYIKGKTSEFQIFAKINGETKPLFNEKEQLHMEDVRSLIKLGNIVCWIGSSAILLLYILLIKLKQKETLRNAYKAAIGVYFLALVGMVVISATDFHKGFTYFHKVFFTNDLWILNPKKDILLMMMPLNFFIDAFIIALIFSSLIMIILGVITWKVTQKRNTFSL